MNAITAAVPPKQARHSLRIALLGYRSHPHVGGQGIYIKYMSRALCDLGHQVDVLSGPPYPQLDARVRLIKIPSLDLYNVMPKHLRALRWRHLRSWSDVFEWWTMATGGFAEPYTFGRRVVNYLKDKKGDYDIIHDNQSLCYGLLHLQERGWPIVATIHHPVTRDRELALADTVDWGRRLLTKRWYSFIAMQTHVVQHLRHIVTVSEASRRDIAKEFNCDINAIQVISNGIDSELFCPQPTVAREPWRVITTTSSDQPLKGFAVLLHAFKAVHMDQPTAELHVIGKLQPEGRNAKLLVKLGLQSCVFFKSALSDAQLVHEYARASVAVCPSLYEGFGLPAAEAMSCGVPLVSSDGGALAEVVGDGGLLVPAGDASALTLALRQVLEQPNFAQAMGLRGRERVEQHFSWRRVGDALTHYYQQRVLSTQPLAAQSCYANH